MSQATPTLPDPLSRSRWAALLLGALALRLAAMLLWQGNLSFDPDGYRRLAENLVSLGAFADEVPNVEAHADGTIEVTRRRASTAYRPPLYPWLLTLAARSPLGFAPSVALLHLALGLTTVWLTARVGVKLGLGRSAWGAGALVALDPILLHQSSLVMTETLAALLAIGVLDALVSISQSSTTRPSIWRYALCGGLLSLATLCRPTFLLLLVGALPLLSWRLPNWRWRVKAGGVYALAALLTLAPWIARNKSLLGAWIVTTTHGGYTFHLANNPGYYAFLREREHVGAWTSRDNFPLSSRLPMIVNMTDYPELRLPQAIRAEPAFAARSPQQVELLLDRLHYADARAAIADEPWMFLRSIFVRWGRLWSPLPQALGGATTGEREALATITAEIDSKNPAETRPQLARYLVGVWYVGVSLLALLGLWGQGRALSRKPWVWTLLLVGTWMAAHALFWTDMRMRAPLVPVVCCWAAAGWKWGRLSISGRKSLK